MQIYGNTHTEIDAIVSQETNHKCHVKFLATNQELMVPKIYIHTPIEVQKAQKLRIDTWFLRKNRIIPLLPTSD